MTKPTQSDSTPNTNALDTPVQFCPGVGPRRAALFNRLGVYTVRDLFWHFPRGYQDFRGITLISHLRPGQIVTVLAEVTHTSQRRLSGRVRHILNAIVKDQTGTLSVVWFNQPYLVDRIQPGARLRLHGKIEFKKGVTQMNSPKLAPTDVDSLGTDLILPVYPLCEGLAQGAARKAIRNAFERYGDELVEFLPEEWLERHRFPPRRLALRALHFPDPGEGAPTDADDGQQRLFDPHGEPEGDDETPYSLQGDPEGLWENARRRLAFEEFFLRQFLLWVNRGRLHGIQGVSHIAPSPSPWSSLSAPSDDPAAWPARFIRALPFELTDDQRRVCAEIEADMVAPSPMNRLLQGDVGSGKTVVSVYAMTLAAAGGCQAALMAPTELLAHQHAENIRRWLRAIPELQTVVLTSSAKASERRDVLHALKTGAAQLVVGTHALFQEAVRFDKLGLVVVDEQHKFGVAQRERLVEKGLYPDLLSATATPIPRTLQLALYGDMDVSEIRTLPPGRPQLITRWTHWENETKLWKFVDEKVAQGQQAYVVCPIISPSEQNPHLPSTEEAFERISQTFLPNRRVAILHGRFSSSEKERLMNAMRAGEIDVVIATTVVEVGVDLPNATMMVVMGAERFGLAQLHQLRGRVGRGTLKSYCILLTEQNLSPFAKQRMQAMEATRDGFEIAEQDLRLRGEGELYGERQSGHTRFRLANPLRDAGLLEEANAAARHLYETDPEMAAPHHRALREEFRLIHGLDEARRPA